MVGMSLTYLASPYTHADPQVREERYRAACKKAAELMLVGKVIFCPIAHSHPIAEQMPDGKANDGAFWKHQDEPYLAICDELIVYMLPGWEQSSGVKHEIEVAKQRGIPIHYERP